MAVPKALNPVGNKIPFSLTSDNHLEQTGVKAKLSLTIVVAGFADGTNLKLDFLGQTWQFDFVLEPDSSGTQLPAKVLAIEFDVWILMLLDALKTNQYIFPYYLVSISAGNVIVFTSRELGETYSIALGEVNPVISNDVAIAGVEEVERINFGFHAQTIIVGSTNEETLIGEDRLAGNEVEFDVHERLKAVVSTPYYFPQNVLFWKKSNPEAVKNFFIRYWERASNFFGEIKDSAQYKAIGGGLTNSHEKLLLAGNSTYIELLASKNILVQTNRPLLSQIHYNQPLQFYFVNHFTERKNFLANLLICYTDDTEEGAVLNGGNTLTLDPDVQGCFIISPALHVLKSINSAKTIDRLEFKITADEAILKSDTWVMQLKESLFSKALMYENSFDTWEGLAFFGLTEFKDAYERLTFETITTKIQTGVTERGTLILNSGWLSIDERNWMRELNLSNEIYFVYGDSLLQVNIINKDFIRHKDKTYLQSLQLEIELRDSDKYFSAKADTYIDGGIIIADDDFIVSDGINTIGYQL